MPRANVKRYVATGYVGDYPDWEPAKTDHDIPNANFRIDGKTAEVDGGDPQMRQYRITTDMIPVRGTGPHWKSVITLLGGTGGLVQHQVQKYTRHDAETAARACCIRHRRTGHWEKQPEPGPPYVQILSFPEDGGLGSVRRVD